MIAVGIVEDVLLIKESLEEYFTSQAGFNVVQSSESVEDFLGSSPVPHAPHVILLDINLPGMTGIEGIIHIKKIYPDAEILMLTIFTDSENIFEALCAGATGYLVKNTPLPQLKESIINLLNGGAAVTPSIARKIIDYFNPKKTLLENITEREMEVIKAVVDGLSYKDVADKLGISIDTVRTYIKRIYRKLEINSKSELMSKFHKNSY